MYDQKRPFLYNSFDISINIPAFKNLRNTILTKLIYSQTCLIRSWLILFHDCSRGRRSARHCEGQFAVGNYAIAILAVSSFLSFTAKTASLTILIQPKIALGQRGSD